MLLKRHCNTHNPNKESTINCQEDTCNDHLTTLKDLKYMQVDQQANTHALSDEIHVRIPESEQRMKSKKCRCYLVVGLKKTDTEKVPGKNEKYLRKGCSYRKLIAGFIDSLSQPELINPES